MFAEILYPNDRYAFVEPDNGKTFTLEELQEIVGGPIEVIGLDDLLLVINEEGKLRGLRFNVQATVLYRKNCKVCDYIVGNALLCLPSMIE